MRKMFKLVITAILAMSIFSCGSKKEETMKQSVTTLKFAALESAYGSQMWKDIIAEYEALNPQVKVELNISKDIEQTLPGLIQAEDYPDVVMLALGRPKAITETFTKEKELADLTKVLDLTVPGENLKVKDKLIGGFTGNIITNPYEDGKLYMLPMFYSPTGLFYNKTLFEQKGWQLPTTWDEMFSLFDIAKKQGISGITYPTTGYLDSLMPAVIASRGGLGFYNDVMSFKKGIWMSKEMNDVFAILEKLAKNTHPTTVSNATNEGFKRNQQLLLDDKALFLTNGTWIVEEMKATTPENFKWGMMAYPAFEKGSDRYSYSFFEQIWVPKQAKNIEKAMDFLAFLYSDKASEIFAKYSAVQPIKSYPYNKLSESNQVFYKVYEDGAKGLVGGYKPTAPVEGIDFGGTLYGTMNSVVNGTKTATQWQKDVNKMMEVLGQNLLK